MRAGLLWILVAASVPYGTLAVAASNDEAVTVGEVCRWIHQPGGETSSSPELSAAASPGFWDLFKVWWNPDAYVEVVPLSGVTAGRAGGRELNGARVVIFTLGRPEPISSLEKQASEDFHFDQSKMERTLGGLRESRTVEECESLAARWGLSDRDFQGYVESLRTYVKVQNARVATYNFEKATQVAPDYRKMGLSVEIVPIDSFAEIGPKIDSKLRELGGARVDLVLELHADRNGRLYDQRRAVVPRSFLTKLQDRVASVALYSCYPAQVLAYYQQELQALQRAGAPIFYPEFKGPLAGTGGSPLGAFPAFLSQHAQTLRRAN